MNLENYSTGQLEAELNRRLKEAALKEEADRMARTVTVVCNLCEGRGWVTAYDGYCVVHVRQCDVCGGTGKRKAVFA